jgi:hypothetical protein
LYNSLGSRRRRKSYTFTFYSGRKVILAKQFVINKFHFELHETLSHAAHAVLCGLQVEMVLEEKRRQPNKYEKQKLALAFHVEN